MNILILNGSARENSNSRFFSQAFCKGAQSKGHNVDIIEVGRMKINGCLGCEGCHRPSSNGCVQNDDMQKVYPFLEKADMIVLSSAVHYWGLTGQLQSLLTRLYAMKGMKPPKAKKYALILSSGSEGVYDAIFSQYNDIVRYFHAESVGVKTFAGEQDKRSEKNSKAMFEFGYSV